MRNIARLPIAAAAGIVALASFGIGTAAAADIPTTPQPPAYPQAQVQPPAYYPPPPRAEGYAYPPPVTYQYPPPQAYYEYEAPPVVVVPRPYYWRRPIGPVYGERFYGPRPYGVYVAHGYGRFDHPWGHYRGW
jgi:hypothetical protein